MSINSSLLGIRAIIFDAVGTLIHPQPSAGAVYAEIGKRFGSKLTEIEIGHRFRAAFAPEDAIDRKLNWQTSEERELLRWRRIVATVLDDVHEPDACFAELYSHFADPSGWRCDSDAGSMIDSILKNDLKVGLASNLDHRLHTVLAGFPELKALRPVIISSEIGWRKPAMQFFGKISQAIGLAAAEILYVGDDWTNDYEGARCFGMRAIMIDPLKESRVTETASIKRLGELRELMVL